MNNITFGDLHRLLSMDTNYDINSINFKFHSLLNNWVFSIIWADQSLINELVDWNLIRTKFYDWLENNVFVSTLPKALEVLEERLDSDISEAVEAVSNDLVDIANYYIEQQQLDWFWTMLDMQFGIQLEMGEDWEQC